MESSLKDKNCIFDLPMFISIILRVLQRRQGVNLRAGNLHGQCPSSIPTSKVSHVTENSKRSARGDCVLDSNAPSVFVVSVSF